MATIAERLRIPQRRIASQESLHRDTSIPRDPIRRECFVQASTLQTALNQNAGRLDGQLASRMLRTQNELTHKKLASMQDGFLQRLQNVVRARPDASVKEKIGKGAVATAARVAVVAEAASVFPGFGRFFAAAAAGISAVLDNSRVAFGARWVLNKRYGVNDVNDHLKARYTTKKSQYRDTEEWITGVFEAKPHEWQQQATLDETAKNLLPQVNRIVSSYRDTLLIDRKDINVGGTVVNRLEEMRRLMRVQEALFAYISANKNHDQLQGLLADAFDSKKRDARYMVKLIEKTADDLDSARRRRIVLAAALSAGIPLALGGPLALGLNHLFPQETFSMDEIRAGQKEAFSVKKELHAATVRDYFTLEKNVDTTSLEHLTLQAMPTFRSMLVQEVASQIDAVAQVGTSNAFLAAHKIASGQDLVAFFDDRVAGKVPTEKFVSYVSTMLDKNLTNPIDLGAILWNMPYERADPHSILSFGQTWELLSEEEKEEILEALRQGRISREEVSAMLEWSYGETGDAEEIADAAVAATGGKEVEITKRTLERGDTVLGMLKKLHIDRTDEASILFIKDNIDVLRKGAFAMRDTNAVRGLEWFEQKIVSGEITTLQEALSQDTKKTFDGLHWWLAGDEIAVRNSYDYYEVIQTAMSESTPQTASAIPESLLADVSITEGQLEQPINIDSFNPAAIVITDHVTGKVIVDEPIVHLPQMPQQLGETPTFRNGVLQDVIMFPLTNNGRPGVYDTWENIILLAHRTRLQGGVRYDALGKYVQQLVEGNIITLSDQSGRNYLYEVTQIEGLNGEISERDTSYLQATRDDRITFVTCYADRFGRPHLDKRLVITALLKKVNSRMAA